MLEFYSQPPSKPKGPYQVTPTFSLGDDERAHLEDLLRVEANPYRDYQSFCAQLRDRVLPHAPDALRQACARARTRDLASDPVFLIRNCPLGEVPWLDFQRPLSSKYELKTDFVSEAWLELMAQLLGSHVVTYSSANNGDHFHDIHPAEDLAYTITQKTVNTLHFHSDLPNNRVRPDWVHLLSLRNNASNAVFTPIVRNIDLLAFVSDETRELLRAPIFHAPAAVPTRLVSSYGDSSAGYTEEHPIVFEREGRTVILYHEGCTTSPHDEGRRALSELDQVLRQVKFDLFLQEGDFVSIANNHCVHARHVVDIVDIEAHQHRWIQKTWNVTDLGKYEGMFMPERIKTSDE